MTSYELDEQFIDNMAQEYLDNEVYQMSDEEQKGFEDHISEEEEEVTLYKCKDIRVDNIINLVFGQPTQAEIEEKSYNNRLKKAKQQKLSEENLYSKKTQEWTNRLANKFNRRIK